MKKLFFLLTTAILLSACEDETVEGSDELTGGAKANSENAISSIETSAKSVSEDIIDLLESDGIHSMQYLTHFFEYNDFQTNEFRTDIFKEELTGLVNFLARNPAKRVTRSNQEELPNGIFEWDATEKDFVQSGTSENLVLKFPSIDSETNNSVLTLRSLVLTANDLPENIKLDLLINEVLVAELSLIANWSDNELPIDAELDLYMNPFELSVELDLTEENGSSVNTQLLKGGESIASIQLISDVSITNILEQETFPVISGHIHYRSIGLEGSIDTEGFEMAFETETDPNEAIDIKLTVDDVENGQIVLKPEIYEGYMDYVPYIEFVDGTSMPVEYFVEELLEDIEEELEKIDLNL